MAPKTPPWQDPDAIPLVRIDGVTRHFGDVYAVDDVSLDIYPGELFSLLGPSGCGKSTLLRLLAGFERPDAGRLFIDGVDVTDIPPYARPVNMMFQSYALFPHMSVEQNIAFGLKQDRMARAAIRDRVGEMLTLLKIEQLARRKPDQLSGGQRQRVALARSLAKHPKLLLLDEPLGALDRKLREHTQFELVNLQEQIGTTFVMVTHDQEEAMTMSSRMAVMEAGRIQQIGTPTSVYEYPANRYCAEFIGAANLIEARVIEHADGMVTLKPADWDGELVMAQETPLVAGTQVTVALRPEKVRIGTPPDGAGGRVRGRIEDIAYLGDISIYHVRVPDGPRIQVTQTNLVPRAEQPLTWGDEIDLWWTHRGGVVLLS
ncbi:MAG: ABC transporter ATP-binding protein [Chromatiales bacterium]|nr:ABC transporter ATP-binding protein [Gammaproteobacteria bacterium]MCP5230992.1 ABC transporter ATP-binding protein [Zoogloeaceae bacterium]MCP5352299.1 ABC transporter ATP-binding protein [Chromatiales bacterium]